MKFFTGHLAQDFIMVHGGAGPMDPSADGLKEATECVVAITKTALARAKGNLLLTTEVVEGLENDEHFNAGYGSALQADGRPRLSASLMDGKRLRFSGVISVSDVRNPSRLALELQTASSPVLTSPGHLRLARHLGLPPADLISPKRFERWLGHRKNHVTSEKGYDTVGVVLSSKSEGLASATSTGGRGYEEPGRVSDSATVAGNYASPFAAISMTGEGEQIVDFGVAVRIECRVRDGMSLEAACRKTFDEAAELGHEYGWIACDGNGNWCAAHTTENMTFAILTLDGQVIARS